MGHFILVPVQATQPVPCGGRDLTPTASMAGLVWHCWHARWFLLPTTWGPERTMTALFPSASSFFFPVVKDKLSLDASTLYGQKWGGSLGLGYILPLGVNGTEHIGF